MPSYVEAIDLYSKGRRPTEFVFPPQGPHFNGDRFNQLCPTWHARGGVTISELNEVLPEQHYDMEGLLANLASIELSFKLVLIPTESKSEPLQAPSSLDIISQHIPEIVEAIQRDSHKLQDISRREFEEVIATLFANMGYTVELTKQSRDGGLDVIAIGKEIAGISLRMLIQAKKPDSSDKAIGVSFVRDLIGVVDIQRATHGILATTARFSSDAHRLIEDNNLWRLHLRDRDDVIDWIRKYRRK
jgi:restriction system protein